MSKPVLFSSFCPLLKGFGLHELDREYTLPDIEISKSQRRFEKMVYRGKTDPDVDPSKSIYVYVDEEPPRKRVLRFIAAAAGVLTAVAGVIMLMKKKN